MHLKTERKWHQRGAHPFVELGHDGVSRVDLHGLDARHHAELTAIRHRLRFHDSLHVGTARESGTTENDTILSQVTLVWSKWWRSSHHET